MTKCLLFLLIPTLLLATDHYPSIKVFKVGNVYDYGMSSVSATFQFWADHMDVILNGGNPMFDSLYHLNPAVEKYQYTNLHQITFCGTETANLNDGGNRWYSALKTAVANTGANWEDCFLHYGDDMISQTFGASGGSCAGFSAQARRIIPADLPNDSTKRFTIFQWWNNPSSAWYPAGQCWLMNFSNSGYQNALGQAVRLQLADPLTWWDYSHSINGFYCDNAAGGSVMGISYWGLDSSRGGPTQGVAFYADVDLVEGASPYNYSTRYSYWWPQYCATAKAVKDSIGTSYRLVHNYVNEPASVLDDLLNASVQDVYFETRLQDFCLSTYSSLKSGDLARMDTCRNHPTSRNYWEYRVLNSTDGRGTSWASQSAFTAFCTMQDTASYFCFHGRFGSGAALTAKDTLYWTYWKMFNLDLGDPTGAIYIDSTKPSSVIPPIQTHVLMRPYDAGISFWVPKTNTGDDTTSIVTINVDTTGYVVNCGEDGSADSTYVGDGTINIKVGHGKIFQYSNPVIPEPDTTLLVTPENLDFAGYVGGMTANQYLSASVTPGSLVEKILTNSCDSTWVYEILCSTGKPCLTPTLITIGLDYGSHPAGVYKDTIRLTCDAAVNSPVKIPITLTLTDAPAPSTGTRLMLRKP